jgi:hypothetical protein
VSLCKVSFYANDCTSKPNKTIIVTPLTAENGIKGEQIGKSHVELTLPYNGAALNPLLEIK